MGRNVYLTLNKPIKSVFERRMKMQAIECKQCSRELTNDNEVEYSHWLTEFFCDPDCAKQHYFEAMQSTVLEFNEYDLNEVDAIMKDGKLYHK